MEEAWLKILRHWGKWRSSLFPQDGAAVTEEDQGSPLFLARRGKMQAGLEDMLSRLEGESPKFTPRYLGHMVSELSLPGILGHVAALLHNPNQTSREVSRATSLMETEAICDLLKMVGLTEQGCGHFTSGGTMANLEFVWRALFRLDRTLSLALFLHERGLFSRERFARLPCLGWDWFEREKSLHSVQEEELAARSLLRLGQGNFSKVYESITGQAFLPPILLAPASRHYSWPKAVVLTGLGADSLWDIPLDENGRLCQQGLGKAFARAEKEGRTVMMVVSVAGATGTGAVDPVHAVQDFLDLRRQTKGEEIWHHIDAAYGGYFCSLLREAETEIPLGADTKMALEAIGRAQSLTLDPHKLGFIPYSCGAFLARDQLHYRSPSFAAPYLLADNAGAWVHTIEGSRAATGVAATWLANRSIGLNADGYGRILGMGLSATKDFAALLDKKEFVMLEPQDLNIMNFSLARPGEPMSRINERTLACFEKFRNSPNFAVSKTELLYEMYPALIDKALSPRKSSIDTCSLTCLRLVLMNPFLTTRETNTSYLSEFMEELRSFAAIS